MTRHWLILSNFCLAIGLSFSVRLPGQENTPTKPLIHVYFTAENNGKGDSAPVPTLSDFEMTIDKEPTKAVSIRSASDDKLLFALLVDFSGSGFYEADSIKKTAMRILQGLLNGKNEGRLVVFNDRVEASKNPIDLPSAEKIMNRTQFYGGTALYDAISATCRQLLSKTGNPATPRRAILLLTDGGDNSSSADMRKATDVAEREGVAIFSLQIVESKVVSWEEAHHATRLLKELSQSTGGQTVLPKKIEDGVEPVLKAIHDQWVLDLEPGQALDQNLHPLQVKSIQKNLQLSVPASIPIP